MKKNKEFPGTKKCEICGSLCHDFYCEKCWKIVMAVQLEPERLALVVKKLRNCSLCKYVCTRWEQG